MSRARLNHGGDLIAVTAERTASKLEERLLEPLWLLAVLEDVASGFLIESDEQIAFVNRAYTTLLGYDSPEELMSKHLSLIVAEEDRHRLLEFGRSRRCFQEAPRAYDFAARCRDASTLRLTATVTTSIVDSRILITTMVDPIRRLEQTNDPQLAPPDLGQKLSPREIEVMEMILAGKRIKEIAFTLQLSAKTVSTHRVRLLRKLNLSDNHALFQYALRNRIIDWDKR